MITWMNHPHLVELCRLGLTDGDYAIAGSWPLFVRGWIDEPGDLDVVARGSAWQMARELGQVRRAPLEEVSHVLVADGAIEILNGWFPSVWSTDEVIDTADRLEGLPFVGLEIILRTKRFLGREKDLNHIAAARHHLES